MILAKTISNRQGGPINYFSAEKKKLNHYVLGYFNRVGEYTYHTYGINDTFRSCKSA